MQEARLKLIREYIDSRGEASAAELIELCGGVSAMTISRDLTRLEGEGVIKRTRGGAVAIRLVAPIGEGVYSQRLRENVDKKRAVARAAAPLLDGKGAVFLDAGTTIMELIQLLPDTRRTLITSGANVAMELSQRTLGEVILLGGTVRGNTLSCSGSAAEALLGSVNLELAVLATSGYSAEAGFTSGSMAEQRIKRIAIERAKKVIMLMDSSKVGRTMTFTFARPSDIDILVSDAALPDDVAAAAEAAGARVVRGE